MKKLLYHNTSDRKTMGIVTIRRTQIERQKMRNREKERKKERERKRERERERW